jgi:hypothetical protein
LHPQVIGGGLRDSFLVDGVAFKKTFSYAGFEQQPKSFASECFACAGPAPVAAVGGRHACHSRRHHMVA